MCGRLWACTSSIPVGVCAFDQVQSVTNQYFFFWIFNNWPVLLGPTKSKLCQWVGRGVSDLSLPWPLIYLPGKLMIFNLKKNDHMTRPVPPLYSLWESAITRGHSGPLPQSFGITKRSDHAPKRPFKEKRQKWISKSWTSSCEASWAGSAPKD